ncbi:MAG: hypothetical protein KatS3mg060_0578 [Dehalococcoidia bacterium]|nr:MAG: hypothetical protein KatS3mg060_0578 [Dehalococcoidia bacterium]
MSATFLATLTRLPPLPKPGSAVLQAVARAADAAGQRRVPVSAVVERAKPLELTAEHVGEGLRILHRSGLIDWHDVENEVTLLLPRLEITTWHDRARLALLDIIVADAPAEEALVWFFAADYYALPQFTIGDVIRYFENRGLEPPSADDIVAGARALARRGWLRETAEGWAIVPREVYQW